MLPGVNIATYNVTTSDPQRLGLDPSIQAMIKAMPLPNNFAYGGVSAQPTDGLNTAGFTFATRSGTLGTPEAVGGDANGAGCAGTPGTAVGADCASPGASRFSGL